MKIYKKTVIKQLFVLEIFIFVGLYFFGDNGLKNINKVKQENQKLCVQVLELKDEIKEIELEVKEWQSSDFFKEKYARERLQMAKEGDEIYFIK